VGKFTTKEATKLSFRRVFRTGSGLRPCGQVAYLDIAEGDLTGVVLEEDVAFDAGAEAGHVPELALGDGGPDRVAAQFVFQDLRSVEPVFDVVALDEDAREVDFAGRFERQRNHRLEHVIERGGDVFAVALQGVGFTRVIEHLVLVAEGGGTRFGDEILDAAIGGLAYLPFPLEVELLELGLGDDVPAAFAQAVQPALLHGPAFGREGLFFEGAPAGCSLAVKKEPPAGSLFFSRKLICSGSGNQARSGQEQGKGAKRA